MSQNSFEIWIEKSKKEFVFVVDMGVFAFKY